MGLQAPDGMWSLSMPLGMLSRLSVVIGFLAVNRKDLNRFYIKNALGLTKPEACTVAIGAGAISVFALSYANYRFGGLSPMPALEYPSTMVAALFFGFVEEVEFRAILLVYSGVLLGRVVHNGRHLKVCLIVNVI
ncbi:MAG: hypothetical protein ACTSU5_08460 [Promethearchaeota archaeon]